MTERPTPPTALQTAPSAPDAGPADAAGRAPAGAGHPAPPVFSFVTFALVMVGLVGGVGAAPVAATLFSDRLALPAGVAIGLAAAVGAGIAALLGAIAAVVSRRLAFYEVAIATLLWGALVAVVAAVPRLRAAEPLAHLEAQGLLVVVLGLVGAGLLAAIAVFVGATIAYLATGSGRLDLSLSYELFVARSHLRLSWKTLGVFGVVVLIALLPLLLALLFRIVIPWLAPALLAAGLVLALARSMYQDVKERRAYRRGELYRRVRMPATVLMTNISISGVAIGVWALTVVLSVMSGFEADLKHKILGHNAHGMVLTYGQDAFQDWRPTRQKVLGVRGVAGATPFLYNEVMLSAGGNLTGSILKGIDLDTVGTVTDLPRNVEDGKLEWLRAPADIPRPGRGDPDAPSSPAPRPQGGKALPGIVVGRELARSLRVFVGDQVNVISPFGDLGPAGPQPKSRPFRVAAIFFSGMYEYDSKFAYMDLGEAQRFFGAGDTITGLELRVDDVDQARAVMGRVVYALGGWPFRAKDWGELNRSLFSALQMEKLVMAVILGFIVLVASFIIVATLIMLVLEKTREIAVLKSMGAGVPSVMKVFVAEGVIIGAIGTAFGLILGYGTCLLIDRVGIPLDPEVYYINNLPVLIEPAQFAVAALGTLLLSFLATIYPATKAARLRPVDGLRAE